jgi:L-ascorbate metabolism protein UlaG (beta-lactamase superfamily)
VIKPLQQDDMFLADVKRTRDDRSATFHLWWLGQSGFLVQWKGHHTLLDPYLSDSLTKKYAGTDKPHVRMTERVIAPDRLDFVDVVTSSHNHTDHLDADTLRPLLTVNPSLEILAPVANRSFVSERLGVPVDRLHRIDDGTSDEVSGFDFHGIAAAHETIEVNEEGYCRYLGYVVSFGDWSFYHSGDTVLYDGMVERLRPFNIDVALLPINGRSPERRVAGNLNGREAAWLAKEIGAKVVIPCHYEMFEFNTASPDEFVAECERLGQPYRVLRAGERFSSSGLPRIAAPGSGPR